jgi:HK97 family phage major capsid protein
MSEMATRLLEQRANTWEQAKSLLDNAAAENRDLTAEEDAQYAKMTGDLESLRARADKYVADESTAKAAEESLRSLAKREVKSQDSGQDDELRSFLKGERRDFLAVPNALEMRALTKGSATAGGNAVPTSFYGQLWEYLRENASLLAGGATIINTAGGENFEVPTPTTFGAAAAVAEAGTLAGTDPAFAKRVLGAFKFGQLVSVSRELVDDEGVDLEGFLARQVGQNVGNAFGTKLITGAGTTEPTGITVSSTLGITTPTGVVGVPTFDNIIDLFYSVIAPYRNRSTAAWLMKDSTAGIVRKLKDTTNQYLWQPSTQLGTPDLLLGKPVITDPNVAAPALSAKSILFGDMSTYFVRLAGGIRFERSDEYAFASDQITFRAVMRGDGLLIDQTGAVKHIVGAAS